MARARMIRTLEDLCAFWSADSPRQLNRRVYKATDCGASISVQRPDGTWVHNGRDGWDDLTAIKAFTIQTIVEGSDATVDSESFVLPVKAADVDAWVKQMEDEASALWREANEDPEDEDQEEEANDA